MQVPPPRHGDCVLKAGICITSAPPEGAGVEELNHVVSTYTEKIHKKRFIIIFSFWKVVFVFDFKNAPRYKANITILWNSSQDIIICEI